VPVSFAGTALETIEFTIEVVGNGTTMDTRQGSLQ
jgi:hypothetical protein